MIRRQIQFTPEQIQILKDIAHLNNISVSEVVRQAVDTNFNKITKKSKAKKGNLGGRLLSIAHESQKTNRRGPKDLSSKVDDYLYGKI